MRAVLVGVLLLIFAACVHRTPPVRLPSPTAVTVAFVQDHEGQGEVADVPEALKDAVIRELATRNLTAQPLDAAKVRSALRTLRASEGRLEWLKEQSQTPYVLLVETKASFFSQLSGRYRWVVLTKLTAQGRDSKAAPTSRALEEAVMLQFDHQRGPQAVAEAAPRIAEGAGGLFDDILAVPLPEGSPKGPRERTGASGLPQPGAIYFVMVDRFANGDSSNDGEIDPADPAAFHGGDLQGVIDHLDELKALGVETVWLSPIFKMRTEKFFGFGAFHGYWIYDFNEVEPRFGDRRLLRRLSDELHRRGMKLLLDVVLNHVGPDAPLVTQKPEWFHRRGPLERWDVVDEVENHDVHGLPDLAQEKPEVYAHLLDASVRWIREVQPDGFRLDAVKHMPVAFWQQYAKDLRAVAGEDFLLLGEMLDGDPVVLAQTARQGGFDSVFDFPLKFAAEDVFCKGQPVARVAATLSLDRLYEDAAALVTLADNHDLPRIVSACGGDLQKVKDLLTVLFASRGTPSLTWGTESALAGAKEPENRGDMKFDEQPLRAHLARLLALRREHPSLVRGIPRTELLIEGVWVQSRVTEGELSVLIINTGEQPFDAKILERPEFVLVGDGLIQMSWRDAFSGEKVKGAATVAARSVALWVGQADDARPFTKRMAEAEKVWRGTAAPAPVQFTVSADAARPVGRVHVVGAAPELGHWKPSVAPAIDEAGQLTVRVPPGVYEFKLAIKGADGRVSWEDHPNRVFHAPSQMGGGEVTLSLKLGWNTPAVVDTASID